MLASYHESRVTNHYDVVVAGASFAGLAVVQHLEGKRVALLDRAPVGSGVTSACAAPVSVLRAMGADGSIQQVHNRLVLHTTAGDTVWPLPEPFCTFDYRRFCEFALARANVEFIQAAIVGRSGSTVHTSLGECSGKFLVDATGWRAVLAGGPASSYVNRRWMAFGIESEVPYPLEPGLHFYFLPEVRDGYAWAFPAGEGARFGVLSYLGRSKLGPALEQFMSRFGQRPASVHGGFLASGLRAPVVDEVFVAGDASGHCLPLTGEGIRTAVLAGFACGDLVRGVLEGGVTRDQAEAKYRAFIGESRRKFHALIWANVVLLALPCWAVTVSAQIAGRPALLAWFLAKYLRVFERAAAPPRGATLPVHAGRL